MSESAAPAPDRRWWLKMLAASVALVALIAAIACIGPVTQLHYHAWRYRTGRDTDGSSLKLVAKRLAAKRATVAEATDLLGTPFLTTACSMVYDAPRPGRRSFPPGQYSGVFPFAMCSVCLLCDSGRITRAGDTKDLIETIFGQIPGEDLSAKGSGQ